VCWDPWRNLNALGCIEESSIRKLRDQIKSRSDSDVPHFRILAMHHPIVFPWLTSEIRTLAHIPVMRMLDENRILEGLNNDSCDPDVGPLAHLILSGHTHAAHPSQGLPNDVTKIKQGRLGDFQFQLVAGALMLNKTTIQAIDSGSSSKPAYRATDFSNASTDRNCRAQILRFYHDSARPEELKMYRIPVISVNGSVYRQGSPSQTTMYMTIPR